MTKEKYFFIHHKSLAESNLDGLSTSLGLLGIAVEHSEAGLTVSAFLEYSGNTVQTFASLFHGSSSSGGIGESQLTSNLLHLTAEEPSLPVPAASNTASTGNIVTASHHHGSLESKTELDALGQSDGTSVDDVGVEKRKVEVATRLEDTHALLEASVPLIFAVLAKELEDAVKLSSRNEIKLVVCKGKTGELLNGDLTVVGRTADVTVGELTNRLGGDGVNLGVGVLERAVPRPVAGSLSTEIENSGALADNTALVGSSARETSKSLGHWGRNQAATIEHLHSGNVPSSNGHLVHGLNLLLMSELLGVVNDGIITASNVGTESLLGGLGNDTELVLAEKLVAVGFSKRNTLGLDGLKASELVNKHILTLDTNDVVLECSVVSRFAADEHGRQTLGVIGCRDQVGKANTLLEGSNGLLRLDLEGRECALDHGGLSLVLGLLSNSVETTIILRSVVLDTAKVGPLSHEPELSAIKWERLQLEEKQELRQTPRWKERSCAQKRGEQWAYHLRSHPPP
ncbi:hypothetical protein HG531_014028 [Fusarium graminearum]|nr:hypothetical protein HG531_014028 [Fusarium graminearum]